MHPIFLGSTPEFLEVSIEPLELREEPDVERVLVQHANGIVWIDRGDEPVARVVDGFEVARRHEAGHTGDREIPGVRWCVH